MKEDVAGIIGAIPYRLALAGGWFDQPYIAASYPQIHPLPSWAKASLPPQGGEKVLEVSDAGIY